MVICTVTHEEINLDTGLYCCQAICVVYIITCQGCRHQYVGKATNTLDIRHLSHRSEMVEQKLFLGIHLFHCKKGNRGFTLHIREKEEGMVIYNVTHEEIWPLLLPDRLLSISSSGRVAGTNTLAKQLIHQTFVTAAIGLKWWSRSCSWASTFFTAKRAKEP